VPLTQDLIARALDRIIWGTEPAYSHGYYTGAERRFAFRSRHETSRDVCQDCRKPNKHGLSSI
jgi:hypothetical protein